VSDRVDVCVIGSGAGGGPVALSLARKGHSVVVLEKGARLDRPDFKKDEIAAVRRNYFVPNAREEPHVFEETIGDRRWVYSTEKGWNANCVGGATVIMSGFFLRQKPSDFRPRSEYGAVEGADVADWPIGYDDLEPWYDLVEKEVGVAGRVVAHPNAEPRSSEGFPFPPLREHPFAGVLDETCARMGLHSLPLPRAVLPAPWAARGRDGCSYSGWCGSYGCETGAKGSSLAALLPEAERTGRCTVRANAMVRRLESDASGRVVAAEFHPDGDPNRVERVEARAFVVACGAVETARLLLLSSGPRHPRGLANTSGQVGRNLLSSTFAGGWGRFDKERVRALWPWLETEEPFVNRAVQDWYAIDDPALGKRAGGTLNFLLMSPSPIGQALSVALRDDRPVWGQRLQRELRRHFVETVHLKFEVFGDYTPHPGGFVAINTHVRDRFGLPPAHVRVERHPRDLETARFLTERGIEILRAMGADQTGEQVPGYSSNLLAGTCRFGDDPKANVLDRDCRAHDVENLWITDGSCFPSAGRVPFTFTIYANAFRVADRIASTLG
jgi:choline dehydrogenase-like flavoprotein